MAVRPTVLNTILLCALLSGAAVHAAPLGTAFTYQGHLRQGGAAVSGTADLIFTLYDAASGGAVVGSAITRTNVPVGSGLFTVQLDFGAAPFAGEARWLQVQVRSPAGSGSYTTLSPRQSLTAVPYATFAARPWITGADGISYTGGNVGIGESSLGAKLHIVTSSSNAANNTAYLYAPNLGPNASHIHWGTTGDWYIRSAANGGKVVLQDIAGNVGVGSGPPRHKLRIAGGPLWTANAWTGQLELDNAGAIAWNANAAGQRFGIGQSGGGLYFFRTTSTPGTTASPAIYSMTISDSGNVGIGTTSPLSARLHVEGGGVNALYAQTAGSSSIALYGRNTVGNAGIFGESPFIGVQGKALGADVNRQAVRGENGGSATGYAGFFSGTVWVTGQLIKGSGSFKIDHPLEPADKYLQHSFVESPDMKNIYDGVVTTDASGLAEVVLPDWFEALNRDFRYQLTVLDDANSDTFVQAKVVRRIQNNRFTIRTSEPDVTVSWQVTGIRHDPYAVAHPIIVEEDKGPDRGKYIYPELYAEPAALVVGALSPPETSAIPPGAVVPAPQQAVPLDDTDGIAP